MDDAKNFFTGNVIKLGLRAGTLNQIHSPILSKPIKIITLIVGNIRMRFIHCDHIGEEDNKWIYQVNRQGPEVRLKFK